MSLKGHIERDETSSVQSICLEKNDILKYQYNYLNRLINREKFILRN